MKNFFIVLLVAPLLTSFMAHKYYLSVMDLEYDQDAKSVQMVTRIFYDDLEDVLNERYGVSIEVDATADQEKLDKYLKKYLDSKIEIQINGSESSFDFIGKEYEDDYVVCYLEVAGIEEVRTFQMTNEILMDLFPEQKNMLHTSINGKKKSFLLTAGNAKALLNFSE